MIGILELTTPILPLEACLRADGLEQLTEDLAMLGGDIFNQGVGFEGQDGDFGCWSRHCTGG